MREFTNLALCFTCLLTISVLSCGGGGGGSTESPSSAWRKGVFLPSHDFHQVCADPSKAYDKATAIQGTYVDENNWLRSFTYETYLWYDEVTDTDPACCSTPEYFELMKTSEKTTSGKPKDQFSFSLNTKEFEDSQKGVVLEYGFNVDIIQQKLTITYVEPNSPASNVGLARGMLISEIDGVSVEQLSFEQLNSIFGVPERRVFTVSIPGESRLSSVTITPVEVVKSPVPVTEAWENRVTGHRVGYMLFNENIQRAETDLINAIIYFDFQDIDDLVLDLRYNPGGPITIASKLAFMIAGPRATTGKVFDALVSNGKLPTKRYLFISYSGNSLPLPSLDLERVFILTGSRTCSASEAIINGLRGIDMEVVLIGETTCGKPYGQVPEDNCGTTYNLIQYRGVNNKGFGSYEDGFQPTCRVGDDVRHQLGDLEEARLEEAITYMYTGKCSVSAQTKTFSEHLEDPSNQTGSPDIIEIWPPKMPLKILD